MRFEPFISPFGDRLLSTNLYSLFAPPSGGLWIGYTSGGFSFLDKGRVTNYASETGTVRYFAQGRNGIVWAATTGGLWRFDHSGWQRIGLEWNAPAGSVAEVGFDSEGILWALVGTFGTPKELVYLIPGTRHFKTAASNLSVEAFTWEPGRTVLTAPVAPDASGSGESSAERLPAACPITSKNLQMVDDLAQALDRLGQELAANETTRNAGTPVFHVDIHQGLVKALDQESVSRRKLRAYVSQMNPNTSEFSLSMWVYMSPCGAPRYTWRRQPGIRSAVGLPVSANGAEAS